jgi:8-oxo-dGTP pyrophosphatase MutT (NUDIX family)
MAGHYVFPGGMLDPADWNAPVWKDLVDLDGKRLARQLGGDLEQAEILAYSVAALRETLEEAGIFFARRANCNEQDFERIIRLTGAGDPAEDWFLKLAVTESWMLAVSALHRWSHWITPVLMKRRYDTRFFLAMVPAGQQCRPDKRETIHGLWVDPKEGIAGNLTGQIPLSPPTLVTLQQLLEFPTLDDLMQETQNRKWPPPVCPRLIPIEKGSILVEPWDVHYHQPEIEIDATGLENALVPAGQPFSRIWYDGNLYRPIKT